MAEPITIARPYARAAFQSAAACSALPAWSQFLSRGAAWVQDAQVKPLIGDPRVRVDQLIGLLQELCDAGAPASPSEATGSQAAAPPAVPAPKLSAAQLQQQQHNFLALLAHNGRLGLLAAIAAEYEQLRAEAERVAEVEVRSAQTLSAAQLAALKGALERRLGRGVRLHESVDAALLGGAVVRYGDFVVDGSLRRRVERLAASVTGA
jgi:F-type H+-transporting ATPase subunit delta